LYDERMFRSGFVALIALLVAVLFFNHRSHSFDETQRSKIEETGTKLQRYASEAYPAWALEHLDTECPASIDELNRYIGASDSLDSWGQPIKLLCSTTMPGGLYRLNMVSAGEDGKLDTDDDLAPF
jgi:hypothetical protein